jgi:hypothetical protein
MLCWPVLTYELSIVTFFTLKGKVTTKQAYVALRGPGG